MRSVRRLPTGKKSPEAVIDDVTVEFKTMVRTRSAGGVQQALRRGRRQSRRVVIDGRPAGLCRDNALDGLARALRTHGGDLDEVLILGDGFDLHWP